ncbi:FTR1 family iron permease [Leadbettera azotonutricia]|uniref:High-affinity iron permease n=1 Tax=Leadbettera azotonutricia (strain ATCC BAA-888 / DSM 13862 / ZAS-9) TaxID=545695 RepID=F5YCH9_LEAAZ|nr:FTR1 family protein [Leadbettera azotonutricia]AEF80768.1 high-affinity iron permease [Leadbettera azotonutricia ZAS-9]
MNKKLVSSIFMLVLAVMLVSPVFAAFETWGDMVTEMAGHIDEAWTLYAAGNVKGAKAKVDTAYYGYYEKFGFEKTVMSQISGARAAEVEYQFSLVKKAMTAGAPGAEVREGLDLLISLLRADADRLDGKKESALAVFLSSLLIIVREGFEAILIVGAIIAYLLKSGNKNSVKPVYIGSLVALAASVLMAYILNLLAGAATGQNQEIIEGATMLLAVVVLFYVSNWMVSKAEAEAWSGYIEGKVKAGISKGSVFSLAFAAFLAVFREGAEVILFYQALIANTKTFMNMIWVGLAVGAVLLVGVYIVIRVLSLKIPLKPFFLGTSVLLFIMSISFIGNGIKELQEGNVVSVSPVPFVSSVDILGIYPTLETLIPQMILLIVSAAVFVLQLKKGSNPGRSAQGKNI